ncbi:MarR family winged helix-turn-helix transcriptional regulator [Propionibacteriaceae bacterium Y1700]|uniref:MarR family winged helix-turn-helix transcriptional regulator n=1 Tax=Microlunatus sp. Y1700 TaxID=3418487 RepID=UPI003DA77A0D
MTDQTPPPAADTRSAAGLASALRPVVARLGRRLRQMRDQSNDLGMNQVSALGVLMKGDLPIGALAEAERVQPPSMTRIVDGLEKLGHVVRRPSDDDRRRSVVSLTESGRAVVLADRRRRNAWLAVRLAELSPAEREVLRRAVPILEKVNHA